MTENSSPPTDSSEDQNLDSELSPITETFGEYLKRHREASGKSLEDIARTTRISKRYLEAFESNDSKNFPEPAFTKGFLRNYSLEVGLDVEDCLSRYEQFVRATMPTQIRDLRKLQKKTFSLESGGSGWEKKPWYLPAVMGGGAGLLVLVVIGFLVFKFLQDNPESLNRPASSVPAGSLELAGNEAETAAAEQSLTRASRLEVSSLERTRLVIRLDESAAQEIIVEPGEAKTFEVFRQVEMQGVDQAGLSLIYNGQPIEVAGPNLKLFNRFLFAD